MKKYYFKGEIVTKIGEDPPLTVIKLQSGKFGAVDPESLIEVREPREEPQTIHSMIVEIRDHLRGMNIVREVLPTTEPSQVTEEWRELGPDEVIQEGDEWLNGNAWEKCISGLGKKGYYSKARRRVTLPAATGKFPEVGARLSDLPEVHINADPGIPSDHEEAVGKMLGVLAERAMGNIKNTGHVPCPSCGKVQWMHAKCQCGYQRYPSIAPVVTESPIPRIIKDTEKVRDALSNVSEEERQRLLDYALEQSKHPTIPEGFPPVPVTPLQLEVGKYYLNRKGERVGPIVKHPRHLLFGISGITNNDWHLNGRMMASGECGGDLISLAPDEDLVVNEPKDSSPQTDLSVKNEPQAEPAIYEYARGLPEIPIPDHVYLEFTNGRPTRISFVDPEGKSDPKVLKGMIRFNSTGEVFSGDHCESEKIVTNEEKSSEVVTEPTSSYPPPESEWPKVETVMLDNGMVIASDGDRSCVGATPAEAKEGVLEMQKQNAVAAQAIPAPVTEDPEEARAKAALEPGCCPACGATKK